MIERFSRPSPRVQRAFEIAAIAHDGAVRKGTDIPYIEHPVSVALILEQHGYPEELVVAGLLHDTVEDTKYDNTDVQRRLSLSAGSDRLPCPSEAVRFRQAFIEFLAVEFGPEVQRLVLAVSEQKNDGRPPRDWLERKREQLDRLATASPDEAALKGADALHNIECTLGDMRRLGLGVLDRFRGGPLVGWHYSAVAHLVVELLGHSDPLATRVRTAADQLTKTISALRPRGNGNHRYPPPTVA
jgi:hypothetical protein